MTNKIGIGIQDFLKLRENQNFYLDKTSFIKEWWESDDDVTLITRPRRFGKTLNMSMVEEFFSLDYAGRGDLFEGLFIWEEEKYRNLQGTYPVISLSFARVKETDFESTKRRIIELLMFQFEKYSFLIESEKLSQNEKEYMSRMAREMDAFEVGSSLHRLSDYLCRYYGKKVIILLDEYDTPMQEAYVNGYWNEMVEFTRSFFNSTFKTNPYMARGIMTGITRVSKESVFSDLNNLKVVTTTSSEYATSFGFTEEEVFAALDACELGKEKEKVKEWYDGFVFGKHRDIYNP
ncbi:MAG: AAA family ATPase, partial [Lachnospiraceae bacterium]|nr:AAA family ATPase [Lachnospiraceae bacterium]